MKGKKTYILLIQMLILSVVMLGMEVSASPLPYVHVEPPTVTFESDVPEAYLNANFTIAINVSDVIIDVSSWSFWLHYNTTLLDAVEVTIGDFVPGSYFLGPLVGPPGEEVWTPINDTEGMVRVGMTGAAGPWPTGNGTMATIKFTITYAPAQLIGANNMVSSALELNDTYTVLFDLAGSDIITDPPVDGFYSYTTLGIIPGAPVADFTWTPMYPYVGYTVTFDASASTPNGGAITGYQWDFNGDGTWDTAVLVSPTTTHVYTTADTYTVILNVTDSEGMWDTDTDYVTVIEIPTALLDVFTIKSWLGNTTLYRERGWGVSEAGSAFVIGETVTLRAYFEFAEIPVAAVNVAFQTNLTLMVATTNIAGNATVSFRLPYSPAFFGTHQVTTTARIFDTDAIDTLDFNVGWMIEVTSVTPPLEPVPIGEIASFTVNVTSIEPIGYEAYPAVITISVFDSMDVPLGTDDTAVMVAPGTSSYILTVTIPGYAFLGPGAYVRVNVFTDYPALGGTAYSPEPLPEFFEIT